MVHELNNIVFVLMGNLEMIMEDLAEGHPCRVFAAEALKAAKRAQTLLAHPQTVGGEDTEDQGDHFLAGNEPEPGPRGDPIRVLLVDDEEMLLEALKMGLTSLGFQVQECGDPQQALDLVRADPQGIDVVVSDLIMPQMDGKELAKQIVNTRHDMPIILMSGYQDQSSNEIAAQAGIGQVLSKPLRFRDLAAAILNCVGSTNGK